MEVWQVVQDFNTAFASNDPDKYFSYVDDDITVITPANPYRVEGVIDDREEFEYSLRKGNARVGYWQAMQPKVQLYGETAVVTFFARGSFGPEGQAQTVYWKITDVLVKKNKQWKVVHIHVSATQ